MSVGGDLHDREAGCIGRVGGDVWHAAVVADHRMPCW